MVRCIGLDYDDLNIQSNYPNRYRFLEFNMTLTVPVIPYRIHQEKERQNSSAETTGEIQSELA